VARERAEYQLLGGSVTSVTAKIDELPDIGTIIEAELMSTEIL
jgi:hypothetical protein